LEFCHCPPGRASVWRELNLLPAPARSIELVFFTLGELFVQDLNLQGKKPDEARSEHLLKSDEMFVRDLGATRLHVGEHLAADIHPSALQACRHEFLAQTQFLAGFGKQRTDHIQTLHDVHLFDTGAGRLSRQKTGWEMKSFRSDF